MTMKIQIAAKSIRSVHIGGWKRDAEYEHVRVIGSDYSGENVEMSFEKIVSTFDRTAYVVIDGKMIPLETLEKIASALSDLPGTKVDIWSKAQEADEKRKRDAEEAAADTGN